MKKTSDFCGTFMAPEIISHLWNIVELYEQDDYLFVLSPVRLGDVKIQDIRIDIGGFWFHHTVLGFKPVDFVIRVRRSGGDLVMSPVLPERTRREIEILAKIKAALHFHGKKQSDAPHSFCLRKAS